MSGFITAVLAASGVLFFTLGAYVLARNPSQKASRSFFLLAAGLGIVCHLQMLIDRTLDGDVALLSLRIYAMASLLSFGAFVILALDLSIQHGGLAEGRRRTGLLALIIAAAVMLPLTLDGVVPRDPGFGASWGPGTAAFILACGVMALTSAWEMIAARRTSTDRGFRSQSLILAASAVLPMLSVSTIITGGTSEELETLAAVGFLAVGAALGYLVTAYTLFQLPTVHRGDLMSGRSAQKNTSAGSAVLFKGKGSEQAFHAFIDELSFGEKGLIITRQHPDQVRERYAIGNARILWLCGQPGEGRVDPLGLTILQNIILEHVHKHGRSIILLDGLEYLISENQMDKVLRLIYIVRDTMVITGSKLLVPLDPQTVGGRDLALIERELDVQGPALADD